QYEGSGDIPPDAFRNDYKIRMVQIRPSNIKFAENLTHRDYLGAILNLGIDRDKTGDILFAEDAVYLSCDPVIADFLCENLTRVRHTAVRAALSDQSGALPARATLTLHANVASPRLDAVVGAAFQASRSSMSGLICGGKVFVNGRETMQGSYMLKTGDVVSVRGYGKFRYAGQGSMTKKGRLNITLEKYV
ncbi:MAG: RNA-binding protein, partial [Lachnospiraceae bacterium]|nr:RNA-binding protein [Lachnospiraceae bacterium]